MGCFCRASAATLSAQLPTLDASLSIALPGADIAMALSAWLSVRGLPAEPWFPDSAWLDVQVPMPQLSVSAIATISALANLRAQVLAQFGLDLMVPAQASAFARIVVTLNARLSAMASINPLGWTQLASLNAAIDQIELALKAGLFAPSASLTASLSMPGGIPIGQWGVLLRPLRLLAPLIAASLQLNVSVGATAEFGAALRVLARLSLPALTAPELAASISAALSAAASLQASLGAPSLQLGLPAIALQVQGKLELLLGKLSAQFGMNLAASAALSVPTASLIAALLAALPKLPVAPGALATSEVMQLAMQATALASLNWQVPASLPSIPTIQAVCALSANLQASLGLRAVLGGPCGAVCDAAALVRASVAV